MIVLKAYYSCDSEKYLFCYSNLVSNLDERKKGSKCPDCDDGYFNNIHFTTIDEQSANELREYHDRRNADINAIKSMLYRDCFIMIHEEKDAVIENALEILKDDIDLTDEEKSDIRSSVLYYTRPNTVSALEAFA